MAFECTIQQIDGYIGRVELGVGGAEYKWAAPGGVRTVRLFPSPGSLAVLEALSADDAERGRVDDVLQGIAQWLAELQPSEAADYLVCLAHNDPAAQATSPERTVFSQLLQRLESAGLVDRARIASLERGIPAHAAVLRRFARDWLR